MALAPPIEVHCGEETYQLSRLTQKLQNEFGLWCERDAWRTLKHTQQYCSEQDYRILLIEHQRMKREQDFELLVGIITPATKKLLTPDGKAEFIRLAMAPYRAMKDDEVRRLLNEYPAEFDMAIREMFGQKKTGGTEEHAGNSSAS